MTPIWVAAVAALVTLTFALTAVHPAPAFAATTVTVTTTLDETQAGNGTCSLREATLFANGTAEPDCAPGTASGITTIVVPDGLYRLRGQALTLTGSATLTGAGAGTTTIDAAGGSRVVEVGVQASVTISDVTITGGVSGQTCAFACGTNDPVVGDLGGGIINNGGTLALTRVIVTGNRTSPGATQTNCVPQIQSPCPGGNGGDGGGIANFGTTTIANSAITANSTGAGASGKPRSAEQRRLRRRGRDLGQRRPWGWHRKLPDADHHELDDRRQHDRGWRSGCKWWDRSGRQRWAREQRRRRWCRRRDRE